MICWFDKAQYLLGQDIRIHVPGKTHCSAVTVYRLEKPVGCDWRMEEDTLVISHVPTGSFGVTVQAGSSLWEGAFDVVADPRQVTRYGFLSDFSSDDGETADIAWMRDLHINAVQFYDWMYRHDALLPPDTKFSDPMGRDMDLDVIRGKVSRCKAWGIRPIAYGAIYAATRETFEQHPQWGMYTMDGQPMTFANWLYYMNVSADCGWTDHILEEYRKAIAFGFSGIHMDTYGFPKRVWDSDGHPVECYDSREEHYKRRASTQIHSFLLQVAHDHLLAQNSAQGRKMRKSDAVAEQLLRFLNQNYSKCLISRDIEEMFEVNFDYINRVFSHMTGSPIFTYINILRIYNAKQLIATTDLPFSEIAYLVGIEDRYYFSKLFRKMTGVSPTEYYKEVRSR